MNLRAVYSLALVLTRSQIRGTQRNRFLARVFGEPRIILPVDIILLLGLGGVGYWILSTKTSGTIRELLSPILPKALADIPSAIMFMAVIFGVLYEISQPIQSLNTDLVNWLPMTPMEYVGGSTVSESYTYSFVLCLFLGVVLGPALTFGVGWTWLATAALSVLALFVGAFVVEIIDASTNRISSSFYKRSGRSGIVFRLMATVILLVFIQLLFSGYIVGYLLQSIAQAALYAWFVPVVWPSLAVLGLSEGNIPNFLFFSSLSVIFALTLFVFAARFRARFWVPVPVSIRLSTHEYRPGRFRLPGVSPAESALLQKDVRSLTRRREMARFLAIPFVLAISMCISIVPLSATSESQSASFIFLTFIYVLPVSVFVAALSMTSIGQEGYAVWNIYAAPLKPTQILRAKMLFAGGLGLVFGVTLLTIFAFLLNTVQTYYATILTIGVLTVLEVSALGVYFSARFPDFREMIRSRYVGVWGSLVGMACAITISVLTAVPAFASMILYGSIILPLEIATLLVGLSIFAVASKLARRQLGKLLQNITV